MQKTKLNNLTDSKNQKHIRKYQNLETLKSHQTKHQNLQTLRVLSIESILNKTRKMRNLAHSDYLRVLLFKKKLNKNA